MRVNSPFPDREFHRRLFAEARLPNVEPLLVRCLTHNHRFKIVNGRERHDLHHAARRHVPIIEAVDRRDTAGLVAALAHHASTIFDDGRMLLDNNRSAGPAAQTRPGLGPIATGREDER